MASPFINHSCFVVGGWVGGWLVECKVLNNSRAIRKWKWEWIGRRTKKKKKRIHSIQLQRANCLIPIHARLTFRQVQIWSEGSIQFPFDLSWGYEQNIIYFIGMCGRRPRSFILCKGREHRLNSMSGLLFIFGVQMDCINYLNPYLDKILGALENQNPSPFPPTSQIPHRMSLLNPHANEPSTHFISSALPFPFQNANCLWGC